MSKPIQTFLQVAECEYTVQKSRFIAYAAPVATPEDALREIDARRTRFPDATHHCYAYIIDENGSNSRFSDDGEPSGTAGMPILNVLKKQGLCRCLIVVTRYFGGILLGAGGLVRAYTNSAVQAVAAAGVGTLFPGALVRLTVPYSQYDSVRHHLSLPESPRLSITETTFGEAVMLRLEVRQCDLPALQQLLSAVLNGIPKLDLIEKRDILWRE